MSVDFQMRLLDLKQRDYLAYVLLAMGSIMTTPESRQAWTFLIGDRPEHERDRAFNTLVENGLIQEAQAFKGVTFYQIDPAAKTLAEACLREISTT